MKLDHDISLFPRTQGTQDGYRTVPEPGAARIVKASVQWLKPQEVYDTFGPEVTEAVKVFLAPETIVPKDAGFDFGGDQFIVQGRVEKHLYGRPNDHLKLYAVTAK